MGRRAAGRRIWPFALLGLLLLPIARLASSQAHVDHNWRTAVADPSGDAGFFTAIAVDGNDRPHIGYRDDREEGSLRYAYWDGVAWQTELVDDTPGSGQHMSIAIDALGQPHMAFISDDTVWTTRLENGSWLDEPEEMASGGFPGPTTLLYAAGTLHLSYFLDDALFYTHRSGDGWEPPQPVAKGESVGFHHDLAVGSAGNPHLVYQDGRANSLHYIRHDGFSWSTPETVEGPPESGLAVGEDPSLLLDVNDQPHISYLAEDQLRYAYRDGTTWRKENPNGELALHSSVMLFEDGAPGISYYDVDGGRLRFTHRLGENDWLTETIVPAADGASEDSGEAATMAADSLFRPHIAYVDVANGGLAYSLWNWSPSAEEDSFRVGVDAPLVGNVLANDIDPDGFPLTANLLSEPAHGCLALSGSGRFEYLQLGEGYTGSDTFTYEACDDNGLCDAAAVSLSIFVPTLNFEEGIEWWAHRADGSRISLRLAGAPSTTWAGVQQRNATSGQWETVKAPDGEVAWHGTADNLGKRPWEQSWWVDQSLLASGPYRWAIYSGDGDYARAYSEPFTMPERAGHTLVMEGPAPNASLCAAK